jgi:PDZ domain-containing protein
LTDAPAPPPPSRRHTSWLTPGRIAATGGLLLLIAVIVLWIAPANGYQLQLVDPAHPVAPLVHVKGKPSRGPGTIYFVDVRERPARLIERLLPWARADGSSLVHSPPISSSLDQRLGQVEMVDSQKIAPFVALKLLGYRVSARSAGVSILQVEKNAPAAKVLQPNDVILALDGKAVHTVAELRAILATKKPGDRVRIRFGRGNMAREANVATIASSGGSKQALLGIFASDNLKVHLPVSVAIDSQGIGGPSAGLAFALEILQDLGRNVAHGQRIAATGELALDGRVLPIGGVKQKTLGARRAHVDAFLVPAGDNAREARRYADGLRIIPVENVQQALRALATLGRKT